MTSITVIGTGNMGAAIAAIAAKGGDVVQVIARDAAKANELAQQIGGTSSTFGDALTGDIVILALPYPALDDVVSTYGAQLNGKTVVDLTNPVDFATFDGLTVPADSSAAAELQGKLPGAAVLKAFNTNFASTLATGSIGEVPTTVMVAGDDEAAKAVFARVLTEAGLAVADAGSLKRARELEALGFLQMVLAVREQIGWTGGFAVHS